MTPRNLLLLACFIVIPVGSAIGGNLLGKALYRHNHQTAVAAQVQAAIDAPVSQFALQDTDRRATREAHTNARAQEAIHALPSTPDAGLVPWYLDTLGRLRDDAKASRGDLPGPADR